MASSQVGWIFGGGSLGDLWGRLLLIFTFFAGEGRAGEDPPTLTLNPDDDDNPNPVVQKRAKIAGYKQRGWLRPFASSDEQ